MIYTKNKAPSHSLLWGFNLNLYHNSQKVK